MKTLWANANVREIVPNPRPRKILVKFLLDVVVGDPEAIADQAFHIETTEFGMNP
jgi:hypothetical protein